jgi:hypothetical protein
VTRKSKFLLLIKFLPLVFVTRKNNNANARNFIRMLKISGILRLVKNEVKNGGNWEIDRASKASFNEELF